MIFCDFETLTFGKWILAGEHSVVRGHPALVFPVPDKQLTLRYQAGAEALSADFLGESSADLHLLFWSVMEHGMQLLGHSINQLAGRFVLDSNIPVGVGMGASAALSVAVSRWFAYQGYIADEQIQSFAKSLEDLFHGQSSGLDIAGVAAQGGVYFRRGEVRPLHLAWQPNWQLTSSGQIGITSHCISQVQGLWQQDPVAAGRIDEQMTEAVEASVAALEIDSSDSLSKLALAIQKANDCFFRWGLVSENLQHHMQNLLDQGALAVKPTGSGCGGFVLSLWANR